MQPLQRTTIMEIEATIEYLASLTDSALLIRSHSEAALTFYHWIRANLKPSAIKSFSKQFGVDLRKPNDRLKLALRIASYFRDNPIYKNSHTKTPDAVVCEKYNTARENPLEQKSFLVEAPESPQALELVQDAITIGLSNNNQIIQAATEKTTDMLKSLINNHFKHQLETSLTAALNSALETHLTQSKSIATKLLTDSKTSLALLLA